MAPESAFMSALQRRLEMGDKLVDVPVRLADSFPAEHDWLYWYDWTLVERN